MITNFARAITLFRWAGISAFLAFSLFPLYWLLKISLTPNRLLFSEGVRFWPSGITFDNFRQVWVSTEMPSYFLNSALISCGAAVLTTLLAALAGYALSRFVFRGRSLISFVLLMTQMFSVLLILVPLNRLLLGLGFHDSRIALTVVYAGLNVPFSIFLMQSFFDAVPKEIDEAAMIDGCTRFKAFLRVVLPLTLPGIGATAAFAFTAAWSELFLSMVLINAESAKTFPPALLSFITKFSVDWGQMAAAGVLALIPVCFFFAYIQKYLVAGLTTGAVKG